MPSACWQASNPCFQVRPHFQVSGAYSIFPLMNLCLSHKQLKHNRKAWCPLTLTNTFSPQIPPSLLMTLPWTSFSNEKSKSHSCFLFFSLLTSNPTGIHVDWATKWMGKPSILPQGYCTRLQPLHWSPHWLSLLPPTTHSLCTLK